MFIVKKKITGKEYFYLRKSVREGGKVKAITVAYLGKDREEAEKKARKIERGLSDKIARAARSVGINNEKDKTKLANDWKDYKVKEGKVLRSGRRKELEDVDRMANEKLKKEKEGTGEKISREEKDFLSFIQEKGFVFGPEPEIYGGMAGFYSYGPLGKLLKNRVENSVRDVFNSHGFRETEGPVVLPDEVWKASGHLETFSDPLIFTKDKKESYRADKIIEDAGIKLGDFSDNNLIKAIKENNLKSPSGKDFELKINRYSLMMKTKVAGKDASLRPETATVTYLPYLRLYNYFRKKVPFGVYQIGKAFRNEISPRQHVIRGREFTQAEAQIFVDPLEKNSWEKFESVKGEALPFWDCEGQKKDEKWEEISVEEALKRGFVKSRAYAWCLWLAYRQFENFGIPKERIRLRRHFPEEKAFYADDAWDVEVKMNNYSWIEVCGVHDRTDYDLKQHSKFSGEKLEAIRENGERYTPHILEIAFGIDRPVYALLDIFYDKKTEKEGKSMFKVPYKMAPIDVAVFPLMKKPELVSAAEKIKENLEKEFVVEYDVSGSIGKRYLRTAISGTPFAVTVDYQTLEDETVTLRDRDTEEQERIKITDLKESLKKLLDGFKVLN